MKKLVVPFFALTVFASCGDKVQKGENENVDSVQTEKSEKAVEKGEMDRDQQIADSVAKALENLK